MKVIEGIVKVISSYFIKTNLFLHNFSLVYYKLRAKFLVVEDILFTG